MLACLGVKSSSGWLLTSHQWYKFAEIDDGALRKDDSPLRKDDGDLRNDDGD